jgi:tetratricopeptide (TPR) repeat protein
MQRPVIKTALLTIILFLSCRCTDDSGVVHFGTFHSDKYYMVTVKYLKEPTTIQDYPCKRGKVRFHFIDSLLSFKSAAQINLEHGSIPAGSRIYLYDNGKPENILLSADTEIQGYGISGKTRMQGYQLSFYNGGELWKFRPVSDEEIDGIFCSHKHEIELYPDGSLMCCHLARDIQGRDNHFAAGTHILLDLEGNIHPNTFPIHIAITRLMNIEEHFSEPLVYAYNKRMEGKVDSVQNMFRSNRNDRNPMIHYESARIKRHLMIGGAEESLNSYLYSISRKWVDPYNVIFAFFHAESMLFIEKNKRELREDIRDDNFYFSAIDGFESVLEMKPDYHAARLHLVDIYSHLPGNQGGDREKAEMHARELLKYDTVWAARAEAMLFPETEGLLDFWLRVGEKHGNDPLLQQELGRAYLEEGDVQNAEACFRKAMELEQFRSTLFIDLARYQMKQVRRDKTRAAEHSSLAESYLLEYIGTNPVNPHQAWCYAKLAWLKDLAGETAEGAAFLEEAKLLDSRFSREEAPPSMLLFISLGEIFSEFESYFRP